VLDWIASFVGQWVGTVGQGVADLVHWAVHALASVVYRVFGLVGDAWRDMVGAGEWLAGNLGAFAGEVWAWTWRIVKQITPYLERAIRAVEADAWRWARQVWADLQEAVADLEQLALRLYNDVRSWAWRDIWLPLAAAADWLRAHLLQWGYTAWWYVTHPAALAALLGSPLVDWLEANADSVARRLGGFTMGLLLHNTRRVVGVLEQILAAVI
jgi:hypothetical protein